MSRLLTRVQLGRVTRWVQTQCFPSSTVTNDPSSNIQRKWPEHVVPLTCRSSASSGFCQVYLVGTVHISQVVFVELCSSRKGALKQKKVPTVEEIINAMWKKKSNNTLGVIINLLYAQLATELKVIPGSEFRVAYEEATKYGGRVFLGDRPIQVTLTRAWRKMPLREKARFFSGLFRKGSSRSSEVLRKLLEGIDCDIDMDMVAHMEQETYEMFPTLVEIIIRERDLFMSSTLLEVAKKSKCVVAVIGRGHLEGMKKHWEQPILVEDLLKIPPPPKPSMSTIILTSVGIVVVGVSMIWGYLH